MRVANWSMWFDPLLSGESATVGRVGKESGKSHSLMVIPNESLEPDRIYVLKDGELVRVFPVIREGVDDVIQGGYGDETERVPGLRGVRG